MPLAFPHARLADRSLCATIASLRASANTVLQRRGIRKNPVVFWQLLEMSVDTVSLLNTAWLEPALGFREIGARSRPIGDRRKEM
jgi:hypothetical protein